MRLTTLATAAFAALTALPAQAQISLGQLSSYLNGLQTARAEFTQINADQTISTGDLTIRRPGRARFDYDPPNKGLVIAGGGQVAIFDPVSNTDPEQYPLRETPLSLILAEQVNLSNQRMVVRHSGNAQQTVVVLQDPDFPEYGNIELVFTPNPVTLRQWKITDDTGSQTTVVLGDMATGVQLSTRLFNIPLEMRERGLVE